MLFYKDSGSISSLANVCRNIFLSNGMGGSDLFHDLDLDLATIVDGGAPEGVILGVSIYEYIVYSILSLSPLLLYYCPSFALYILM